MSGGLATGGIVTKPTLALLGEDRWEGALVPIEKYREMEAEFKKHCPDRKIRITREVWDSIPLDMGYIEKRFQRKEKR